MRGRIERPQQREPPIGKDKQSRTIALTEFGGIGCGRPRLSGVVRDVDDGTVRETAGGCGDVFAVRGDLESVLASQAQWFGKCDVTPGCAAVVAEGKTELVPVSFGPDPDPVSRALRNGKLGGTVV